MKVCRFAGPQVFERARELTGPIDRLTANSKFARDYGLKDQMRRAGVSIRADVAEGFSRKGDKEFGQFLFVAQSSAAELQGHVYVALDQGYIGEAEFRKLYDSLDHISRMTSNLIKHLTTQPRNGRE